MDQAWQQEMELQRQREILSVLLHVRRKCGDGTALFLASEFGLKEDYRQHTERVVSHES